MKAFSALLFPVTALAVACGVQGSATRGARDAESNDGDRPHVTQQTHWTGTWRLVRQPPQARPGFSIEVAFDSVSNGTVYGKLLTFFSGNVGIDPRGYRPFSAPLRPDSLLSFTVAPVAPVAPVDSAARALFFSGLLKTDTLVLSRFAIGIDTVRAEETEWFLVKQK